MSVESRSMSFPMIFGPPVTAAKTADHPAPGDCPVPGDGSGVPRAGPCFEDFMAAPPPDGRVWPTALPRPVEAPGSVGAAAAEPESSPQQSENPKQPETFIGPLQVDSGTVDAAIGSTDEPAPNDAELSSPTGTAPDAATAAAPPHVTHTAPIESPKPTAPAAEPPSDAVAGTPVAAPVIAEPRPSAPEATTARPTERTAPSASPPIPPAALPVRAMDAGGRPSAEAPLRDAPTFAASADDISAGPAAGGGPERTAPLFADSAGQPVGAAAAPLDPVRTGDSLPDLRAPPRAEPHRQLADAIVRTREGQIEVLLDPVELGRVTVLLGSREGPEHLTVLVERPETLDLIRQNSHQLLRDLRENGMPGAQLDDLRQDRGRRGDGPPTAETRWTGDPAETESPAPHRAKQRVSLNRLDIRL